MTPAYFMKDAKKILQAPNDEAAAEVQAPLLIARTLWRRSHKATRSITKLFYVSFLKNRRGKIERGTDSQRME